MALKVRKATYPEKLVWVNCKSCERRFAVFVSKAKGFGECGDCEKKEEEPDVPAVPVAPVQPPQTREEK